MVLALPFVAGVGTEGLQGLHRGLIRSKECLIDGAIAGTSDGYESDISSPAKYIHRRYPKII